MSVSNYRGNYGGIFGNYSNENSNCTRLFRMITTLVLPMYTLTTKQEEAVK